MKSRADEASEIVFATLAVACIAVIGSLMVMMLGGCYIKPMVKPDGPAWRCWIENAGRVGEVEICERDRGYETYNDKRLVCSAGLALAWNGVGYSCFDAEHLPYKGKSP